MHVFVFIARATAVLYSLSLHDALPICVWWFIDPQGSPALSIGMDTVRYEGDRIRGTGAAPYLEAVKKKYRSEEHTSELQSRVDLVCRLLLEKKNGGGRAGCCAA